MINPDSLTAIGKILKTHGINGEMSVTLYDIERADLCDLQRVVFILEGIPVPFFVSACRPRGAEGCIVAFEDIDSEERAEYFTGLEIYAFDEDLPERSDDNDGYLTLEDLIGYTIVDSDGSTVGLICGIEDSTENILFEVEHTDGNLVHVPAAEPLITELDTDNKILTMNLPTGLF